MQGSRLRAQRPGRNFDYPGPDPKIASVVMTDKKKPAPASMPLTKNTQKKKPTFHRIEFTCDSIACNLSRTSSSIPVPFGPRKLAGLPLNSCLNFQKTKCRIDVQVACHVWRMRSGAGGTPKKKGLIYLTSQNVGAR